MRMCSQTSPAIRLAVAFFSASFWLKIFITRFISNEILQISAFHEKKRFSRDFYFSIYSVKLK